MQYSSVRRCFTTRHSSPCPAPPCVTGFRPTAAAPVRPVAPGARDGPRRIRPGPPSAPRPISVKPGTSGPASDQTAVQTVFPGRVGRVESPADPGRRHEPPSRVGFHRPGGSATRPITSDGARRPRPTGTQLTTTRRTERPRPSCPGLDPQTSDTTAARSSTRRIPASPSMNCSRPERICCEGER